MTGDRISRVDLVANDLIHKEITYVLIESILMAELIV